jgi:hypothetical protein
MRQLKEDCASPAGDRYDLAVEFPTHAFRAGAGVICTEEAGADGFAVPLEGICSGVNLDRCAHTGTLSRKATPHVRPCLRRASGLKASMFFQDWTQAVNRFMFTLISHFLDVTANDLFIR